MTVWPPSRTAKRRPIFGKPDKNISFESKLSFSKCNESDEIGWKTFAMVGKANMQKQKEVENPVVHRFLASELIFRKKYGVSNELNNYDLQTS